MKHSKRLYLSLTWLVIGTVLIALSFVGIVDEYFNGMGFGLAIAGALQLLRYYRLMKDEQYREKVEVAETDERNLFIHGKAWAWAGYLFILSAAILSIVFKITGRENLSTLSWMAVCLMLALYWGAYMVIKRKY